MSKKNKNPYRDGSAYQAIFSNIKKRQVFTRQDIRDDGGKPSDVTVVMSPRESSKRGDCRGNMSAQGHLYFVEKLARKIVKGVKEVQKFRLRWRKDELEPRNRNDVVNIPAKKVKATSKAKTTTEAKAKSRKATAKA